MSAEEPAHADKTISLNFTEDQYRVFLEWFREARAQRVSEAAGAYYQCYFCASLDDENADIQHRSDCVALKIIEACDLNGKIMKDV